MGMEGHLESPLEDFTEKRIALLDTSTARKITWTDEGKIGSTEASPRLLELLEDEYDIWIVSTRAVLHPDGVDKCLFDLIDEERFLIPDPDLDLQGCASSPALIDLWVRGVEAAGGYVDEDLLERKYLAWMDVRHYAEDMGIVVR